MKNFKSHSCLMGTCMSSTHKQTHTRMSPVDVMILNPLFLHWSQPATHICIAGHGHLGAPAVYTSNFDDESLFETKLSLIWFKRQNDEYTVHWFQNIWWKIIITLQCWCGIFPYEFTDNIFEYILRYYITLDTVTHSNNCSNGLFSAICHNKSC